MEIAGGGLLPAIFHGQTRVWERISPLVIRNPIQNYADSVYLTKAGSLYVGRKPLAVSQWNHRATLNWNPYNRSHGVLGCLHLIGNRDEAPYAEILRMIKCAACRLEGHRRFNRFFIVHAVIIYKRKTCPHA